ncbi:hypothetical protein TbgDal_III1720 [Trypanosoma brucei gambiense DAL972]|uniref:Uncharacterized protein n=1 Tax=Trypanosoma brucei gambiense (strain MHOM/CI/86/DAL972) TaxID=679716 RepID=C9ZK69_TRYB9|nr:hypothetical protein TbgDal_III1720 [Trypanosoma brucei gambiense DAL972]CBH09833.1 hypothetical protein TbgDal_III1720 [Trypanosoma brucei gambiense DAL972]|eukprot:XP_011772126.1 hypothetical protein TbgDal_III1720 [Trypanosoma brucei gambiense DAL972]
MTSLPHIDAHTNTRKDVFTWLTLCFHVFFFQPKKIMFFFYKFWWGINRCCWFISLLSASVSHYLLFFLLNKRVARNLEGYEWLRAVQTKRKTSAFYDHYFWYYYYCCCSCAPPFFSIFVPHCCKPLPNKHTSFYYLCLFTFLMLNEVLHSGCASCLQFLRHLLPRESFPAPFLVSFPFFFLIT